MPKPASQAGRAQAWGGESGSQESVLGVRACEKGLEVSRACGKVWGVRCK